MILINDDYQSNTKTAMGVYLERIPRDRRAKHETIGDELYQSF